MKKILLQFKDDKLFFSIKKRLNTEQKSLINTNVISQNELVFSDEYMVQNSKIVHNFIKELINDMSINTVVIKESEIATLVLKLINNISKIKNLYLLEESILTYHICSAIIKCSSIKYVSLYNIPTYLLEMLDKEDIIVDSRNEMLFLSPFMKDNNLDKFSTLYYKTSIYLNLPLSKEDEDDFISFININKYLRTIYLNKVQKSDIEYLLEILYKKKLKNIKIYIEQDLNNIETIEYLKKINKHNSKVNGIQFKIDYSKKYLQDNLMNQIHLNTIKMCIIVSLMIVGSVIFYVFISNYTSMQKVEDIKKDINETIAEYKEELKQEEKNVIEQTDETDEPTDIINQEETPVEPQNKPPVMTNDDVAGLLSINEDTVGWLKVNNTNVDYPVVQASDNEFYLKRNFKKNNDNSGWIFMDYRADAVNLSQNTIIFGHNMYYSGVMFGTLYKVKQANWYRDPENQIIEFDSLYEKMKWKIFSIYTLPNTNDYLISDFSSDDKYQEFLNLITGRSIYTFNTPVSVQDKILTLSTCSNNGKNRLVIHAVLLEN